MPPDVVEWLDRQSGGSRSEVVLTAIGHYARKVEADTEGRVPAPPSLRHGAAGQK